VVAISDDANRALNVCQKAAELADRARPNSAADTALEQLQSSSAKSNGREGLDVTGHHLH